MPPNQNQTINIKINANTSGLTSAASKATSAFKTMGNAANGFAKTLGNLSSAMKKVSTAGFSAPLKGIGALGGAISKVNQFFENHNKTLALSANYYKGLVGQVSNLNRFINVLGSSVRQIGQGLQNFGTSFTLYVSAPVSAFIYSMTKGFIEFQDRMIEVRRTTGLAMSDIDDLGKRIQEISLTTPTSVEDLASVAADWGRLGITDIDVISKLTQESDKLMIATSLTKDQVVNDLGKIGSLYFETEGELAENYSRVASAINELGQASPVSEQDIVGAFLRAAPVGQLLDISLPDMLGLATTVAERAASPERAGSQLSRALTEQASKVKLFADALGMTREEVVQLIDTDAISFFVNMLDVIGKLESKTEQVAIAEALFGGVGSKAVNALAANMGGLIDNLVLANEAYDDGTSIQKEYLRATDSVKVQLGILQNNFRFLGFTIAEQVIPYISKFAAMAIPALRSITKAFEGLSERTKFLVVGFGLLLAVAGPLTIFLGSFLFSIGIITTGLTAMFTQVIGVGVGLGRFLFSILALLQPIGLLVSAIIAIGAAFVYISGAAAGAGSMLAGYITQFVTWGYNLMGGFAQGIADGAKLVYDVVMAVINGFIGLIQAFSPPKEGPLRGIRDWGRNLMGTYAEGIEEAAPKVRNGFLKATYLVQKETEYMKKLFGPKSAQAGEAITQGVADGAETNMPAVNRVLDALKNKVDDANDYIITVGAKFSESFANALKGLDVEGMDLFTNIFGEVRGIVEAVANNLGLEKEDTDKRILRAADAVQKLIAAFESGGNLGSLESLYSIMGGLGDEADDLVKSQIEYNNATKDLERIKKQATDVDDALRKEIAAISARSDLTMNQKTALIRNARFRSTTRKTDLKEEEKVAQDRVDVLKDELKRREQILNTLSALMFPAKKEPKEKAKKEDEIAGSLGGFNPDAYKDAIQDATDATKGLFDQTGDQLGTFFTKIDKAQKIWEGFVNGITGGDKPSGLVGQDFWTGWIPGNDIREKWMKLQDGIGDVGETMEIVKGKVKGLLAIFAAGTLTGYLGVDRQFLSNWGIFEKIILTIGYGLGLAVAEVETLVNLLKSPALKIWDEVQRAGLQASTTGSQSASGFISAFLKELNFGKLGEGLAEGFNQIINRYLNPDSEFYKNLSSSIATLLGGVIEFIAGFIMTADLSMLTEGLVGIVNTIIDAFGPNNLDPTRITGAISNLVQAAFDGLSKLSLEDAQGNNVFGYLIKSIVDGLIAVDTSEFITNLKEIIINLIDGLGMVDWVGLGEGLSKIINNLLTALGDKELWLGLGNLLGGLISGIAAAIEGINWGLTSDIFVGLVIAIKESIIAVFSNSEIMNDFNKEIGVAFGNAIYDALEEALGFDVTGGMRQYYDKGTNETKTYNKDSGEVVPTIQEKFSNWWSWWNGDNSMDQSPGVTLMGEQTPQIPTTYIPGSDPANPSMQSIMPGWGKTSGEAASKEYATAVDTGLRSPETVTLLTEAIAALTADTSTASTTEVEGLGTTMGGVMMTGLVNRVSGETATKELDQYWLNGLNSWVTSRETELDSVGMSVGNQAIHGFLAETNDAQSYMGQWSTAAQKWLSVTGNAKKFNDTGINIGIEMVKGIADVLTASGPVLASIAESAQAGTPMVKSVRDKALTDVGTGLKTPAEEPVIKSSLPTFGGISSNQSTVQIAVTIEGGTPQDQRQMREMTDRLYDKMRKEAKIKGVNI